MSLRDVIGQEKAVNILLRTLQRGRIPSAYLFAGESGIGKKFTAINLAKALNCLNTILPPFNFPLTKGGYRQDIENLGIDACDECSSCKKIDSGVHPDIRLISPDGGQIRIEEIRAIEDALSLKAFEGRKKIIIVEEADTMNPFAANAFLKTLEEPPAGSLIILISSIPDRLPETIRSRCSRINFSPLSYEECKKVIKRTISNINKQSMVNFQKEKDFESWLSILARLSMGRPGLAVSTDLLEEREWFLKLFREMIMAEKDGWNSKEDMEKWFEYLLIFLRDLTFMKITKYKKYLINIDIEDYIKNFSSSIDLKVIIENYQKLSELKGYFNFNLNKSLTWNYTGSLLRVLKSVRL